VRLLFLLASSADAEPGHATRAASTNGSQSFVGRAQSPIVKQTSPTPIGNQRPPEVADVSSYVKRQKLPEGADPQDSLLTLWCSAGLLETSVRHWLLSILAVTFGSMLRVVAPWRAWRQGRAAWCQVCSKALGADCVYMALQ
jgi:hypothetical protein